MVKSLRIFPHLIDCRLRGILVPATVDRVIQAIKQEALLMNLQSLAIDFMFDFPLALEQLHTLGESLSWMKAARHCSICMTLPLELKDDRHSKMEKYAEVQKIWGDLGLESSMTVRYWKDAHGRSTAEVVLSV
jgi:hypothetical protein